MADIVSTLGLHGVPELFRRPYDIDHYKGQKAVIAIMAVDRNHPEFVQAEKYFSVLEDDDDVVVIAEDHPGGVLHERFQCGPQDFCLALINKEGQTVLRDDHVPTLQYLRDQLSKPIQH